VLQRFSEQVIISTKTSRRSGLRSGLAKRGVRLDGPARVGLGENLNLCTL